MPDEHCKECYECNDKFNTFRRRHHCRVCGQIFCSRCCNQEVPGKVMGFTGIISMWRFSKFTSVSFLFLKANLSRGYCHLNIPQMKRSFILSTHFMPMVFFHTPWKHKKLWFSDVFRGYRKRPVAWNRLEQFKTCSKSVAFNIILRYLVWKFLTFTKMLNYFEFDIGSHNKKYCKA